MLDAISGISRNKAALIADLTAYWGRSTPSTSAIVKQHTRVTARIRKILRFFIVCRLRGSSSPKAVLSYDFPVYHHQAVGSRKTRGLKRPPLWRNTAAAKAVCRNGEIPPVHTIGKSLWRIQEKFVDTPREKRNKNSFCGVIKNTLSGYNFPGNRKTVKIAF